MPQLSLYISDKNLDTLRRRSSELGISMSRYANRLIEQDEANGGWQPGFWDLYGAIDDDAFCAPADPPPADDAEFEALFR